MIETKAKKKQNLKKSRKVEIEPIEEEEKKEDPD